MTLLRTRSCGEALGAGHGGLRVVPTDFTYVPYYPARHPFVNELGRTPIAYLPSVILTNRDEVVSDRRAGLDTLLIGDGIDGSVPAWEVLQGKIRLAELFLNVGLPANEQAEYDLESELGYRGLAAWSHELKILLPGSFAFEASGLLTI